MIKRFATRIAPFLIACLLLPAGAFGSAATSRSASSTTPSAKARATVKKTKYSSKRKRRYYERFYTSSFDPNNTEGDIAAGEDPVVRQAAEDALGNLNGTVVAIDPETGRILSMVNQKLALSEGAQPCSTFKVAVGLAGLSEGLITKDTPLFHLGRRRRINVDLTYALAHSNNRYFEELGRKLGFERVAHYAQEFGFGELAGLNIEGEHLGVFPSEEIDEKLGGVGKMCSFGEGISFTPLQLGAFIAAVANGGNLYYLQHPESLEAATTFQPKLKRTLAIKDQIPEVSDGMFGAVEYGTAQRLRYTFVEEPVLGKTGTCSKDGTRFGWFASYANTEHGRIVTVVFLRGGHAVFGPKAAEITGRFYRNLYDRNFFGAPAPVAVSGGGTH